MKTYTYHKELRIILAQVLNAFGDLIIKRLQEDDDTDSGDHIAVSLQYAPKQRVIYDLVNLNQHIQLPAMAITMASISYDKERTFNKIMGFTVNQQYLSGGGSFPEPVPIKINLNFSILSRYQRDLDQILTCIYSNFYPYIIISYQHPDIKQEVRCAVMWNGDINLTYPVDIQATAPYRIVADSSFTVYAWMYRNASNPYGIIHNIPTTFTAVSNIFDDYYSTRTYDNTNPITTDYFTVSGRPQINSISPYSEHIGTSGSEFTIMGDMFQFVTNLVVSASPTTIYQNSAYQAFNPFVSSCNMSAMYPPFSGVQILSSNWTNINEHTIKFTLPTPLNYGFIDVIAVGSTGYGKLTQDSLRPTFNPYLTSNPSFSSYSEFQYPYVSGLEIS